MRFPYWSQSPPWSASRTPPHARRVEAVRLVYVPDYQYLSSDAAAIYPAGTVFYQALRAGTTLKPGQTVEGQCLARPGAGGGYSEPGRGRMVTSAEALLTSLGLYYDEFYDYSPQCRLTPSCPRALRLHRRRLSGAR